jgi:flagellum-specific peptidoglycan hydrolase FlgJ
MRFRTGRPTGRIFFWWLILAVTILAGEEASAATSKTSIVDVLYRADGTPAQGTLLISFGQSRLSREANNYFGIKAYGKHDRVAMPTHEVENGMVKAVTAEFTKFQSMEECFAARDRLIATSSLFAEARVCPADVAAFARAIAKHWATDPAYAEKILAIHTRFKLHSLAESAVPALGSA